MCLPVGSPPPDKMPLIKTLTVNQGDIHYGSLFRLPRGSILRLKKGPTLYGVPSARIFTNHPEKGVEFDRHNFRPLEWNVPQDASGCELIMADHTVDLPIASSGSFRFYLEIDGEKDVIADFIVDPIFTMGKSGELLPMDCIQCVTVLPKSLGRLPDWESRLRVLKETGYNMIHFTPVQELGGSMSSYSLRNQHKLNPMFGEDHTMEDLAKLIRMMETDWKVLSICDIVLNHTANESEWLLEHPEATYNVHNMPHLRPAYLFDRLLWRLTCEVADGKWVKYGVPAEIASEEHLQNLKKLILDEFLPLVRIHELFMVDADHIVQALRDVLRTNPPTGTGHAFGSSEFHAEENQIVILQDPEYRRFRSTVEFDLAVRTYGVSMAGFHDEEARLNAVCGAFKAKLEALNHQKYLEVQRHLETGIENVLAQNRYRRFDPNGPKEEKVTRSTPITGTYFYAPPNEAPVHLEDEESKVIHTDRGKFRMAHNGWVMNHDPLVNFALPGSHVYLRRELIEWGDSVKLRYGDSQKDSPFLWDYMTKYVVDTAKTFHGLRLDNCHSTPLNVAEHLLDEARKVNPNLYVTAELFTNSLATDNVFVARLGINSLIREALSAHTSQEEGRLVYFYGGKPVGSFDTPAVSSLTSVVAHAIFFDQTHDNECPMLKRSVYDALPSAALVSMAACASGSTRGYDELVPHMVHVVNETRFYTSWGTPGKPGFVDASCGIIAAKKALNDLHYELGLQGFSELFVDQKSADVVVVTRHSPSSRRSVILVAHTAFASNAAHGYNTPGRLGPVTGNVTSIRLAARFYHKDAPEPWDLKGIDSSFLQDWKNDENFVTGLEDFCVDVQERVKPEECNMVEILETDDGKFFVDFKSFPPGSVVAFEVSLDPSMEDALKDINAKLVSLESDLTPVLDNLDVGEFNFILFRCEAEQKAETPDRGCYGLSNGPLVYSGLQGFMSVLEGVETRNDQGHPMCQNLRDGPWMLDYVSSHFKLRNTTAPIGQWLENYFASVKRLPNYLAPCYFAKVLRALYNLCCDAVFRQMSPFIKESGEFVKGLALSSLQFLGVVHDGELPSYRKDGTPHGTDMCSLSAGLPHFSTGYMRNWGRDTFISLTGLCLLTGRFKDAKNIILSYASVLRHGLIPNLLNKGSGSRYNARDAVWFWLYSIQKYAQVVPNGIEILKEPVARHYLNDDDQWGPGDVEMTLEEVMQEALQRHFGGEKFRERNAGEALDRVMKSEGFNNEIGVDAETGFVFGGNQHNCGTWMDKMGSSQRAGNIGIPATPRNGSAVELVGLCYATVRWLSELSSEGKYGFAGVEAEKELPGGDKAATKWSWKEWAEKIRSHFDEYFYMDDDPSVDRPHQKGKLFVRGLYQDCLNSFPGWADFQARPNFFVALSVAPDMVKIENALRSLECGGELLEGPLGVRTLSPHDAAYRPDYFNSETDDFATSCGLNYHNGPEWVWLRGFYLNAILEHAERSGNAELLQDSVKKVFDSLKHLWWLLLDSETNPWKGLPELTNRDGSYCAASCRTQAWSVATLIEVAHKLDEIKRRNKDLKV